ncbi:MAG TPA: hypothetical protein VFC78_15015 [Tepidisphaeraceae bacterium]|nr:hypothetical protein [Tepidisphaeraceae bacterium]
MAAAEHTHTHTLSLSLSLSLGFNALKRFARRRAQKRQTPIIAAALWAVEALEQRVMLTGAPAFVSLTPGANLAITGSSGAYTAELISGGMTVNQNFNSLAAWQNLILKVDGGTAVAFNSPQTLGALNLDPGSTVNVTRGDGSYATGSNLLDLHSLSFDPAARLDLGDSDMILHNGGSGGFAVLEARATAAFDGGKWDLSGLASSAAADPARPNPMGLGVVLGSSLPSGAFDGMTVNPNDVDVKYTLAGDVDLNGTVNLIDYHAHKE